MQGPTKRALLLNIAIWGFWAVTASPFDDSRCMHQRKASAARSKQQSCHLAKLTFRRKQNVNCRS